MKNLTVVIPAKNESRSISSLIRKIKALLPETGVLVVDDGSIDGTAEAASMAGAQVLSHPYSMGNGAAVKSGMRAVKTELAVLMDGDGQHDPAYIPQLLTRLNTGYDMVVGARDRDSQASFGRLAANTLYNRLAGYMTGQVIPDLTSGFRAVRTDPFREFLNLLPNGFSYPTTITMAFFRSGYSVAYLPIQAPARLGKSHIRPVKDGVRFLAVIFKIGSLYSPFKIFTPISLFFFVLGFSYYLFTFFTMGRFTNMSALLLSTSVLVFLIGLVSEQITQLMYLKK